MIRKHFIDVFKRRARSKIGDDLTEDKGIVGLAARLEGTNFQINGSDSEEKIYLPNSVRRWSETAGNQSKQVRTFPPIKYTGSYLFLFGNNFHYCRLKLDHVVF